MLLFVASRSARRVRTTLLLLRRTLDGNSFPPALGRGRPGNQVLRICTLHPALALAQYMTESQQPGSQEQDHSTEQRTRGSVPSGERVVAECASGPKDARLMPGRSSRSTDSCCARIQEGLMRRCSFDVSFSESHASFLRFQVFCRPAGRPGPPTAGAPETKGHERIKKMEIETHWPVVQVCRQLLRQSTIGVSVLSF